MKTAIIAFLSFCFYLLGGHASAMGAADCSSVAFKAHVSLAEQFQVDPDQHYFTKTSVDFSGDDELLASVEDDDDDQETGSRKHVMPEHYFPAFVYVFLFNEESISLPGHIALSGPISRTSSDKYIQQGVLRI